MKATEIKKVEGEGKQRKKKDRNIDRKQQELKERSVPC